MQCTPYNPRVIACPCPSSLAVWYFSDTNTMIKSPGSYQSRFDRGKPQKVSCLCAGKIEGIKLVRK